ncbi:Lsm1p KNAG_0J02610 [Huiozyma naganishii CBS 8797]|uniref:U6 snRNA-associated Sm-like protein LSm1 n=1 Tax=Huiozyma naganishii (strain ATCC MYA-139 / BCRC 22969 / CBS 8797 / KCTC 17520 / NBRC 10181 / NCYC 3082 / Yp74L-3) TaxID=1071383 RepID=J7RBR8_HUIN7|nr:hypothetical protein KNAG_0J02610 [Kazachstania naganishii CBS 8797]CCK72340.1 hypothetical protein KNAG_0J02610 [Kazachstania naganishii CBS 8797]
MSGRSSNTATPEPSGTPGSQQPQQQQQRSGQRAKGAKKISEGEADLYLDQYNFTTTAAIVSSVDRKIFVLLRDGKLLFGVLRTFDQYANLLLQHCVERIYLEGKYAEEDRGVFMVRGENVVMLGEVDIDKEDEPLTLLERVPFSEAESTRTLANAQRFKQETDKTKEYARYGLSHDFYKSDMY